MTRRVGRVKVEWETPENGLEWHHIRLEVLMDIRAELTRIRQLLECHNIPRMFRTIDRIDKRISKRIKLK